MPGDFDLVKERIDLVQLIGEKVPLKRAGRIYKGLCPFHGEKTPSFTVDPERRTYHCFGCSVHGDCFTWVQHWDGLDASESLRVLAERAGVELTRRAPQEREHEKKLLAAHEAAHFYFRQALRGTDPGKAAAQYLAGRGIIPATVEKFGLGYAPAFPDGLLGYLRKKGFTDQEAVAAGLVIDHERGLFDRFRDRLMIPIRDGKGRAIAFAGRAMRAQQPAKYMNSPTTALFDKGDTLFALDVAKAAVRRKSEAVIVEGQFDAIAAHQAGFDNVVASMGTALTAGQYRILDDLRIEKAVVAFDGDVAGTTQAEKRGRELAAIVQRHVSRAGRRGTVAARTGLGVYVAVLPQGTDPDVLARTDPDRLRAALAGADPVLAFVIEQIRKRSDLAAPDGRRRFLADTLPLLADEPDPLTREVYLGTLSRHAGVGEAALREQLASRPAAPAQPPEQRPVEPAAAAAAPGERSGPTERYLMAQLLQFPEEAAHLDLDPEELADPDHRAIFELIRAGERPGPRYPARLAALAAALGASTPQPVDEDHAARAVEMLALRLRAENVRRRMSGVQAELLRGSGEVGTLMDRLTVLRDDLAWLMREQERDTVLRTAENEDE
ncbi:MAG: DNA primase [Chloroflexi bacterium]|nr:DNA primase [Chloroflexota bacterium]